MKGSEATVRVAELDGHPIRTTAVDGTEFVAVADFCNVLEGLIDKVAALTRHQQEQIAAMNVTIDVLYDMLSTHHPELQQELLRLAQQRRRPV